MQSRCPASNLGVKPGVFKQELARTAVLVSYNGASPLDSHFKTFEVGLPRQGAVLQKQL